MPRHSAARVLVFAPCVPLFLASPNLAAAPAVGSSGVSGKAVRHADLFIAPVHERARAAPAARRHGLDADLLALGAPAGSALYDVRAGRWGTLVTTTPLVPGRGNRLRWSDLGTPDPGGGGALGESVWVALRQMLERWQPQLRLDLQEIGRPRVSVSAGGTLIHVHAPRVVGGVPVRDAALTAVVSHGNLVLLGLSQWGDVAVPPAPAIDADRARQTVAEHLRPFVVEAFDVAARLELIPLARGADAGAVVAGSGYDYRLAWVVGAKVEGDVGSWEALVDATSGGLLALEDTNEYQSARTVVGGVYPASNDGVTPDGVEQPGYPMPYADVQAVDSALFTSGGGGAGCREDTIRTTLGGRYVRIADACGPIDETSAGALDLGTSAGTNCTVPAGHSAGDTHAARTTYYELNRIMEQARGYLPENEWLQAPLTANVNVNAVCNAFWNGFTVNFFRDGSGCANTGELASIVDHEFAHGLDNNGANPSISRPSDVFGHIQSALWQRDSCIGRGFLDFNCGSFGDPCLACTGIDDVDFARHASGAPHGLSFAMSCPVGPGGTGPCGRINQCESLIVAEAAWDLFARDLRNPATFNYDEDTALEVATRLFYLGSQNVGDWYACNASLSGCGALGGYLNLLAADDDDGSLSNGTPHMSAIFAAFNRHGIACSTPALADAGCGGGPTAAPALTAAARDQGAALSWTPVAGATRYAVYRAEGVKGCGAGKAKVAETSDTSFRDDGLLNGFAYHYTVLPIGDVDGCRGRMSACQTVTPASGPNLAFDGPTPFQLTTGDGDAFLDNCEVATVHLRLENTGGTPLSNVRILSVTPVGSTVAFLAPFPVPVASSLSTCGTATGSFSFRPQDLTFDATAELLVTFTADELFPETRTALLREAHVESDFAARASRTFSFETDLEGWQVVEGTWSRTSDGGGAGGTSFHVRSSQGLDDQCDRIQSPLVRLDAGSTLSLSSRYQIEPPSVPVEHYDRANVGIATDTGTRTTISPDGGNLYTVPPGSFFRGCTLFDDPGWNGTNPGNPAFSASSWSPAALSPDGTFTGLPVRLDVVYATDVVVALDGFRFDEVTLTNFAEQVPDAQANACSAVLYFDAFDDGVRPPWAFTGTWRERNGFLSSRRRLASAFAGDFAGCVECSLTTAFRTGRGRRRWPDRRVVIWFHWQDDDNHVALELADGQAVLRRVQDGAVADSASAAFPLADRRYRVRISYAGEQYGVSIDGADLLSLKAAEAPKGGTFGLGSNGAVTSVDYVAVE
jgi:hypothetical protein